MVAISIIIPTYNRASVIVKTLDSILAQTYNNWECIVVDDHSTDNTKNIVQSYCTKDSRFKYLLNNRKKGAQGARNTGLFASASEWIFFFDSDNFMHPDLLEEMLAKPLPDVEVIKCFSDVIDSTTGKCIDVQNWRCEGNIHKALFNGSTYIDFNQAIVKRESLLEINGLDEDCPSLQEFDTNIRLSEKAHYHTIEKPLVDYYVGGTDTISANYEKQVRGKYYNLKKYKREWLENKANAARVIYELMQKLNRVESLSFRVKYALKLAFAFPQMIPYYIKKHLRSN